MIDLSIMLSRYQQSEVVFGTLIFALIYFMYRTYFVPSKAIMFDLLYTSAGIFLILFLKNFAISYYQLSDLNA